jgi:hypothetical protein
MLVGSTEEFVYRQRMMWRYDVANGLKYGYAVLWDRVAHATESRAGRVLAVPYAKKNRELREFLLCMERCGVLVTAWLAYEIFEMVCVNHFLADQYVA